MCENAVPVVFPTVQRLRATGLKVRFKFVSMTYNGSRTFTSAWNPVSSEELMKEFLGVSDVYPRAKLS
jgi:hypothetical protein